MWVVDRGGLFTSYSMGSDLVDDGQDAVRMLGLSMGGASGGRVGRVTVLERSRPNLGVLDRYCRIDIPRYFVSTRPTRNYPPRVEEDLQSTITSTRT